MSGKALVSGCDDRVAQVAAALREGGAEVVSVDDPAKLRAPPRTLKPGSLSHYVQLPVSVDVSGSTLVGRVQTFLEKGLLARFEAADAVLPALREDANVVLVSGTTVIDGGRHAGRQGCPVRAAQCPRPRDQGREGARGRAGADCGRRHGSVGDRGRGPAHRATDAARDGATLQAREAEMSYADWRIEVMGLATVQV